MDGQTEVDEYLEPIFVPEASPLLEMQEDDDNDGDNGDDDGNIQIIGANMLTEQGECVRESTSIVIHPIQAHMLFG
jgi:hypothetical protein